jgi:hypothetical protein
LKDAESPQWRFGSPSKNIYNQVRSGSDSDFPVEGYDRTNVHTYLFTQHRSAIRIPPLLPNIVAQGADDQLVVLVVTGYFSDPVVVRRSANRKLVLVPCRLPPQVQVLWCSGRKRDYLVYALQQSPKHLITKLVNALTSVSSHSVTVGVTNPSEQ